MGESESAGVHVYKLDGREIGTFTDVGWGRARAQEYVFKVGWEGERYLY